MYFVFNCWVVEHILFGVHVRLFCGVMLFLGLDGRKFHMVHCRFFWCWVLFGLGRGESYVISFLLGALLCDQVLC